MWTILKLLGGYSQIIGGYIPPSPPCFGTPGLSFAEVSVPSKYEGENAGEKELAEVPYYFSPEK